MKSYKILIIFFFCLTPLCASAQVERQPMYQDCAVMIKFKPEAQPKQVDLAKNQSGLVEIDRLLHPFGAISFEKAIPQTEIGNSIGLDRVFQIEFSREVDVPSLVKELNSHPEVEYAEPCYLAYITDVFRSDKPEKTRDSPNDPYFSDDINHRYHMELLQAEAAWDITHGSSESVIAIVDNGVEILHQDVAGNLWINEAEANGEIGVDDDNNGYIDDIHGYDFYDQDGDPTPGDQSSDDHGTHCAGIACAVTDNNTGIASISWNCRVMGVRSGSNRSISRGYQGIYYAAHQGADVISCSWSGYSASRFSREVVEDTYQQGAVIIAAAGNDGNSGLNYPAAYDHVIAVANTNSSDIRSSSSNYGEWVDISAPGQSIWSLLRNDGYGYKSGTSMSTPLVAGLCGLLKSHRPDWDQDQIATQAILSADNIDEQNPDYVGLLGSGRANARNALTETFDAIILTDRQIDDDAVGNGSGEIDPGETVDLYLTLRSLFSSIDNVSLTISTTDNMIGIVNPIVSYGDMDHGESATNSVAFELVASENLPRGHAIDFDLSIDGDGYHSDVNFIYLVPPSIGNHESGNIIFTLTSDGELGMWQATNEFAQGSGFIYPAGEESNILFSGTFAAGTDADYVCDAYFNNGEQGGNDWQVDEANDGLLYFDSSPDIPQIGHALFSDGNHPNPKGLQVVLESWTFSDDPDDDYVILNYELSNTGASIIENLYTATFVDWDIGDTSQDDEAGIDEADQFVWQRGNDYDVFAGIAAVDPTETVNLTVIDNEVYVYDGENMQDSNMIQFLNGTLHYDSSTDADDYNCGCSTGPYILDPDYTVRVSFILSAGDNLNDLRSNIQSARDKFYDVVDIEVSDLIADPIGSGIKISWNILDTTGVLGFHILRRPADEPGQPVLVNPAMILVDHYTDEDVTPGVEYLYWVEATRVDGERRQYGPIRANLPFPELSLNFVSPNPVITTTRIQFNLPSGDRETKLDIYNIAGQLVKHFDSKNYGIGLNREAWDRRDDSDRRVKSGVYILRLEYGGDVKTKKMIVLPEH